jgi:orotate phosphoribosyltransferase
MGEEIPYVCVTGTRVDIAKADPEELIIGLDSPLLRPGMNMLVIEELVNFAETTTMSADLLRKAGYNADQAATLFSYDHEKQRETLRNHDVELLPLIALEQLLDIAEERFEPHLVASYREFLADPMGWQTRRGIEPPA